jgi:transposase
MNQVSTVGLDLAKHIFQLHGADSAGAVVFRAALPDWLRHPLKRT